MKSVVCKPLETLERIFKKKKNRNDDFEIITLRRYPSWWNVSALKYRPHEGLAKAIMQL